ncbi:hypothetical protein [Rhodoferax bucti]|uniref:hypothetical protein n=1 Tax=Rhodoferax bucti TaxID=2576305 RepID=UPI001108C53E|nr:hypothetical protein [Rhodoferax bucti]
MQKLEQRISALEAKQPSAENEVTFIYIPAMGQDDETITSTATQTGTGYKRWVRGEGEPIADFRTRIEKDCMGKYAPETSPIRSYWLLNQYPNGAHYALTPREERESWGAFSNNGSGVTIHKVGGALPSEGGP